MLCANLIDSDPVTFKLMLTHLNKYLKCSLDYSSRACSCRDTLLIIEQRHKVVVLSRTKGGVYEFLNTFLCFIILLTLSFISSTDVL